MTSKPPSPRSSPSSRRGCAPLPAARSRRPRWRATWRATTLMVRAPRGARSQRRAPRRPAWPRARRLRLPVPRRHRRRRPRDPRPPLRLGRQGVVGAAGRHDGALREGRDRALHGAARRRTGHRLAGGGRKRLGRPGRRGAARRPRGVHARDDLGRAARGAAAAIGARRTAWLPFSQATADTLPSCAAPGSTSARCAARPSSRSATPRRRRTLSLVDSIGEPRFTLDVNWDPDTIPAFLALPACEAHGRSLPLDPYLVEPLEHYLRTYGVEVGGAARRSSTGCGSSTTPRSATSAARARTTHPPSPARSASAASCGPSSAPASPTRCGRGGRSWPTSRASARPCRRWPRSRPTTPGPPS